MMEQNKGMELNENELMDVNGGNWFTDAWDATCDWCSDTWDATMEWYEDECNQGAVSMVLATAGAVAAVAGTAVIVTAGVVTVGPAVAVAAGVGGMIGAVAVAPDKREN